MNGKIEFGIDYLTMMRNLELNGHGGNLDDVDDAAARLFLLQWGFTPQEIDQVNATFWDRADSHSLEDDLNPIAKRLADYVRDDPDAADRLVVNLAAVGNMDLTVTPEESSFVWGLQNLLDMKSSHFAELLQKGTEWAVALNFFGDAYSKAGRKFPAQPQ